MIGTDIQTIFDPTKEVSVTTEQLLDIDKAHSLPTFRRFPVAFEKARGAKVWDIDGKEYIDLLAGIAVHNVGHCHPKVVAAIAEQSNQLMHISNFFVNKPQVALTQKLIQHSQLKYVFLSNSGAEAVEGAMKVARKYASKNGRGGTIITMKNAFHGRTMSTVAATGKKAMMVGFDPIPTGYKHVPFNDFEALKLAIDDDVAGIMFEPVQGEGGINVVDGDYLRKVRELCDQENIVLILDEIQCGMGRTGKMFAHQHFDVMPDVMPLAKALGGGMPIGAILANERVGSAIDPGDHGTTFGGNPLAAAAALATVEVIEEEELPQKASETGTWLKKQLHEEIGGHPLVKEIRGIGLMIGIELTVEAKPLVLKMLDHGIIANATAINTIRLVPPLNIGKDELLKATAVLKTVLNEAK
ncbi:MAG: aspartate aminotransferase family protein [Bacteroidota bacterium]